MGEQIRAGDGQFGLRLGAQDWLKEEILLRNQGARTPDSGAGGCASIEGRGTMEQK